jgi:ribonuclease T2
MKYLVILNLISSLLIADNFYVATKSCEATNNLKSTKNSGNISVISSQRYKMLDTKPHSIYVQVPNANPSGRWVKKECFKEIISQPLTVNNSHAKLAKQSLLALSWHNGFCGTHRNKTECKKSLFGNKEYGFVLHGLWPQPKNLAYCGVNKKIVGMDKNRQWSKMPNIGLSEKSIQDLAVIMPAIASGLQNHEWYKHGTCSGMNSTEYFAKASTYTTQFNNSKVAKYINDNRGKIIILKDIKSLMSGSFGVNSAEKIDMVCDNGILTEIRLNLGGSDSSLAKALASGSNTKSSCQRAIVDEDGWR